MALYVPPTEERDPKKQNQSLQLIGGVTQTNTDNIATNTADIATNTADIATNTAAIAAIVVPAAATQTEQETATSTAVTVTPGRQQYHPSAAKAWIYVTYSGGTPTIQASYNVASIVDAGVGNLTVNFTVPFSSVYYAGVVTQETVSSNVSVSQLVTTLAVGSCTVLFLANNALADPVRGSAVFFGDQ